MAALESRILMIVLLEDIDLLWLHKQSVAKIGSHPGYATVVNDVDIIIIIIMK